MLKEFLYVTADVCAVITISYSVHCIFNSLINYLCKPRDLTPEEINQIRLNVERESQEREVRIRAEVEEELNQLREKLA